MTKIPLTIRMPVRLKEKLNELSSEKGLTLNAIIVQTLWNEVQGIK